MTTLLAFYRRPDGGDEAYAEFERGYAERHLPLIAKVPGLRTIRVARVRRPLAPADSDIALVARMAFGDWETAKGALNSPEMAAAAQSLAEIGGTELATMLLVEEADDLIPEPFR